MRALIQRASYASVTAGGERLAEISRGVLILLGIGHGDTEAEAGFLAEKIAHLRIFADSNGKSNLSLKEIGGAALVVSQFTLYADVRKGRRPSFTEAAEPESAKRLVRRFIELLVGQGIPTQSGAFGEHMLVEIHNDGPFTIWLER
jgi:D-tyrosyl-tRNA(Tyr) deacylase